MADSPRKTPYQMIGGEAGIERLVKVFYDLVECDPAGAALMVLHNRGHGLAHARQAQFEFLSGFLGGPQLYMEHHGHMNVRQIHAHLEIGAVERDSWLTCMDKALTAAGTNAESHDLLMRHFIRVAEALRNKT